MKKQAKHNRSKADYNMRVHPSGRSSTIQNTVIFALTLILILGIYTSTKAGIPPTKVSNVITPKMELVKFELKGDTLHAYRMSSTIKSVDVQVMGKKVSTITRLRFKSDVASLIFVDGLSIGTYSIKYQCRVKKAGLSDIKNVKIKKS